MTRGPSPDQVALIGLAEQIMRGRTSNEQLATVERSSDRVDRLLWQELSDAGLVGIAIPQCHGGAGLGLVELCLLLEVQGRRLAPVPLWETTLLGADALLRSGTTELQDRWLPGVADGSVQLSAAVDLAAGTASARDIPHGHLADAVVVPTALGAELVETAGLTRTAVLMTNHTLAADLDLDGVAGTPLAGPVDWDRARLGLAALLLGLADEGVREAAAHLSGREQFGRPLGTFQATTQQLGDAYCDVQAMRATLWQAVWALDNPGSAARRSVEVALWWAVDAAQRVQHTVQHLHGGLGADTSYPVHRRLLWTMRAVAQLGSPSRQLARLGAELGEPQILA